jgi:SAM-dependent methyltransferase
MSGAGTFEEFDAAYWEDRYRSGEGTGRREPSASLVTLAAGLAPGRALDAGCGTGGDALWLAAHGWRATAVDVSGTAVETGRRAAQSAGPAFAERLEWVTGDLLTWHPGQRTFDLVTSHYVHVPGPPEVLFARLASWVALGGSLLVVGHADQGAGHGHGQHHQHSPGAQVRAEQVVSALPSDAWEALVAEPRTHTVARPDGSDDVRLDDVVVHMRRRADSQT